MPSPDEIRSLKIIQVWLCGEKRRFPKSYACTHSLKTFVFEKLREPPLNSMGSFSRAQHLEVNQPVSLRVSLDKRCIARCCCSRARATRSWTSEQTGGWVVGWVYRQVIACDIVSETVQRGHRIQVEGDGDGGAAATAVKKLFWSSGNRRSSSQSVYPVPTRRNTPPTSVC